MSPARIVLVAVALAFAASAHAQAPASAVPKHKCTKPDEFPGRLASDRRLKSWQQEYNEYGACVKKYTDDMKVLSEEALKAANGLIDEYNAFTKAAKDASGQ